MIKGIETANTNLPSTEIQNKTFSSRSLSPKSRIEGTGTVTTNGSGAATTSVTHGLAYAPAHLFFYKPGNTNAVLHPGTIAPWVDAMKATTWGLMDNDTFTVDAKPLRCDIRIEGVPNTEYTFKYFIFVEPAQ